MNETTPPVDRIVFLVDVDNTLLDNDRFGLELSARLDKEFGRSGRDRFWAHYEARRTRLGFADYLGALEDFRAGQPATPPLLQMSAYLLEYPFAQLLYADSLAAIGRLRMLGAAVILSDGDVTFQPRKIQRSGIWDAVSGKVLICLHKQDALEFVQRSYPAVHYVVVDDKPALLGAMKLVMGRRLTTVWVRQGHYARDANSAPVRPAPDLAIDNIAALVDLEPEVFLSGKSKES